MAHPQNSPRGSFYKQKIGVGDQTETDGGSYTKLSGGLSLNSRTSALTEDSNGNFICPVGMSFSAKTTNFVTQNSTGLILPAGLAISARTAYMATEDSSGNWKFPVGISASGATSYITQNSTAVKVPVGLALSGRTETITQSASAVVLPTGLSLSGKSPVFTANSTSTLVFPTVTAIPTTRSVGGMVFVSNSTGKMLAYHSTGTTWKYLAMTSVLA